MADLVLSGLVLEAATSTVVFHDVQVLVSWSGVLHLKSAMSTRVWQVSFSLSHCPSCQLCALAAMVVWLWSSVLTGTSLKSGLVWIRTCPGSTLCLATTLGFKSLLCIARFSF